MGQRRRNLLVKPALESFLNNVRLSGTERCLIWVFTFYKCCGQFSRIHSIYVVVHSFSKDLASYHARPHGLEISRKKFGNSRKRVRIYVWQIGKSSGSLSIYFCGRVLTLLCVAVYRWKKERCWSLVLKMKGFVK